MLLGYGDPVLNEDIQINGINYLDLSLHLFEVAPMNWKYSIVLLFVSISALSQDLKSPSEFLGYELGDRFTRHYQVVDYCQYLARNSSGRVQIQEYGKTYEGRPLLLLHLSSSENMSNLEEIRLKHLQSREGGSGSGKAIVWMSYNVHGNESVSTEAAMQTLYELLTSKKDYLENTVVIVDPCINPDGRDRYVNWYYQVKNHPFQVDPGSREHHEGWHRGRSNHYMFDLNRDWAWLTQKESQHRLAVYSRWYPQIHVDFHEQGVDSPYYFAPAAEPFHEVITGFQRQFQEVIGRNHARYFDEKGWLYFTKERFDLFYPSYGDTYPTYNGAIGMTYEQGGSGRAGLGVITRTSDTLTLKDRIEHHLTTGLSTVEVASKNVEKLNEEYAKFFTPKRYRYQSYVMKGNEDHLRSLKSWLDNHGIEYGAGTGSGIKGYRYFTGKNELFQCDESSLVVRTDQPKGTLVKVLFEPNAKLSDSLTYDITAWSLPFAYGLDAVATESRVSSKKYPERVAANNGSVVNAYAYIGDWNSMDDARFLVDLLQQGIRVRTSRSPFTIDGTRHERGSLIILRKDNEQHKNFNAQLLKIAAKHNKVLHITKTGFADEGKDLGSDNVRMIPKQRIALLSGEPGSTLRFGEIWHFFEQQLFYPMSVIDTSYLENIDLNAYDVLIIPGGSGHGTFFSEELSEQLHSWVSDGGTLVLMGGAIKGFAGKEGFSIKARKIEKDSLGKIENTYEMSMREQLKEEVKGAIFRTRIDPTHPLAFGYGDFYYTLKLRNGSYELLKSGNVSVIKGDTDPVAGFSGSETPDRLVNSLVFGVEDIERGQVVYMVDNPLFRGFWENGKLFFVNALFMVN